MSKHFDGELNTEGRAGKGVVETGEAIVHQLGSPRALRPDVAYLLPGMGHQKNSADGLPRRTALLSWCLHARRHNNIFEP